MMLTFNTTFYTKNILCEFNKQNHKLRRLFGSPKQVLIFSDILKQIKLIFSMANLINTHLRLTSLPKT